MAKSRGGKWYARTLSSPEFARRLGEIRKESDVRVVWFLGAGCSKSSGIPDASELVKDWLPRLMEMRNGSRERWEELSESEFPGWSDDAARYYGKVIEELFESEGDRQREIERLTGGRDPGFGYAALAQLMSHPEFGRKLNVAITVNFDDLIADSIYLYTAKKPLVISHESLTQFLRRGDQRPLVVKVHGDARLAPKNTTSETSRLDADLVLAVRRLCSRARVVVVGYGGADKSIAPVFLEEGQEPGPEVIYWVNDRPPSGPLISVFSKGRARVSWVPHRDFDSLMVEFHTCFDLGLPNFGRLESLQQTYKATLERLRVTDDSEGPEAARRGPAVEGLLDEFRSSRLASQARSLHESDPEAADDLYEEAVKADPTNVTTLINHAQFLSLFLHDFDRAQARFEEAITAEPTNDWALSLYATFLQQARTDYARSEELLQQAIAAKPTDAELLNNYGVLLELLGEWERADEQFQRALEADPRNATALENYAYFLVKTFGKHERAREIADRAEDVFKEKLAQRPSDGRLLSGYAGLLDLFGRPDEAEEKYERALAAPRGYWTSTTLNNYGAFLLNRGHLDHAEEVLRRALVLRPDEPFTLAHFSGLMFLKGNLREGKRFEKRARKAGIPHIDLKLWFLVLCYDRVRRERAIQEIRSRILRGVRARGKDLVPHLKAARKANHPDLEMIEAAATAVDIRGKGDLFLKLSR